MKIILLFFLLFFLGYGAECLAIDRSKEELLEALAQSKSDTIRLKILLQLTEATIRDDQKKIKYINQLQEEAEKQNNDKYKCHAYLLRANMAYNMLDAEGVSQWFNLLEPLARKEKEYDLLFLGKRCFINILMLSNQYELEEREGLKMLKEAQELNHSFGIVLAYHALSHAYLNTYRSRLAFETLEKAYNLARKEDLRTNCYEITHTMIITCELRSDYKNWYRYLNLQQEDIRAMDIEKNGNFNEDFMINYISFLKYYIKVKDWEKAVESLDMMDQYYSEEYSNIYKYYYWMAKLDYYKNIENWPEAIKVVEVVLNTVKDISESTYCEVLIQKAKILRAIDKDYEALAIYKQVKVLKDSLSIDVLNKQIEQLKKSYNADMLLLEKEKNQQQAHWALIILIGSIIFILVVFIIHTQKIRRNLTKAEHEMRVMKNDMEEANRVKERFLSNINMTIRPSLNAIVNNSFTLSSEEEISPSERERLSDIIRTTSEELMRLINDILNLSKLESGMMKYNIVQLDAISTTIMIADKNRVTVSSIPDNKEYVIDADMNHFIQIVDSLTSTPLEASQAITLQIENMEDARLKITFSNSMLASEQTSQETIIRNEINRMLIEHFKGEYKIDTIQKTISIVLSGHCKEREY